MNYVRSNNISLKYQRFATLDSKDIGIRKSEFVAQFSILKDSIPWSAFKKSFLYHFNTCLRCEFVENCRNLSKLVENGRKFQLQKCLIHNDKSLYE